MTWGLLCCGKIFPCTGLGKAVCMNVDGLESKGVMAPVGWKRSDGVFDMPGDYKSGMGSADGDMTNF